MVLGQPTLVRIRIVVVRDAHRRDIRGIGGIEDGKLVGIRPEHQRLPDKVGVWPVVHNALGIVGVPGFAEIPHQLWRGRIGQIEHNQASTRQIRPHRVKQAGFFIDDHVVGVGKTPEPRRRLQRRGEAR